MSDLVVVSNRGPATLYVDETGALRARHGAGGLAPSLAQALSGTGAIWVAAATTDTERRAVAENVSAPDAPCEVRLVDIDPDVSAGALRVIANSTLWFCHHDLFERAYRPAFTRPFHQAWERYREYNATIADAVCECASEGATVVVNDYHLCLVGSELSSKRPDLKTVHFSHTPFCTPEELRVLPSAIAAELIGGLSAFGACGFHTSRWAENFSQCVRSFDVSPPSVFVSPLGVDGEALVERSQGEGCNAKKALLRERVGDRRLVIRSDRLELSKNVVRGFLAFEELLSEIPTWVGRVVFAARVYPSREDLPEYLAYRSTVEQVVARINERFSSRDYRPIELDMADDFDSSLAAASLYDVLLVNPIRDGMNLVAKEGPLVNKTNGVLVLSKEAGAFAELGDHCVPIEPFDVSATAAALQRALVMDEDERRAQGQAVRAIAAKNPPAQWFESVASRAEQSR